jgi:hypothetical protein
MGKMLAGQLIESSMNDFFIKTKRAVAVLTSDLHWITPFSQGKT